MADNIIAELRSSLADLLEANRDGVGAAVLGEFGWPELYGEDPRVAVTVLFEELGRHAGNAAGLEVLVAQELGDVLPSTARIAVLRPDDQGIGAIKAGTGMVTGTVLTGRDVFDHLVAIDVSAVPAVHVVVGGGAQLSPIHGVDPGAGAARVAAAADVVAVADAATSARVVGAVRRAVAIEQVALGREMLRVAVDHVCSRTQFGRPIGANQSVQHRLADVHVAVKAASAAIDVSWQEGGWLSVAVAAGLGSRAADVAIRNTLQVCGGMGFTEEFALAPLIRRSLLLAELFDTESNMAAMVGETVLASNRAGRPLARLGGFVDESP